MNTKQIPESLTKAFASFGLKRFEYHWASLFIYIQEKPSQSKSSNLRFVLFVQEKLRRKERRKKPSQNLIVLVHIFGNSVINFGFKIVSTSTTWPRSTNARCSLVHNHTIHTIFRPNACIFTLYTYIALCVRVWIFFFLFMFVISAADLHIIAICMNITLIIFHFITPTFRLNAFACIIIMVMVWARTQIDKTRKPKRHAWFSALAVHVQMCFQCLLKLCSGRRCCRCCCKSF